MTLLQEMNVNTHHHHTNERIRGSIRHMWEHATFVQASTSNYVHSPYKPGGTLTIASGTLAGRIKSKTCETFGRWSEMEVFRSHSPPLTIINAYMVCSNSNPGPLTYQMQLY